MEAATSPSPPPLPFPPWPRYSEEEIQAVAQILRSGKVNYLVNFIAQPGLRPFEQAFAQACQCDYGVALANGTVALELALYGLDIGPGDEVIVPSRSFIASASCVAVRGAKPVFAEVEADSQNLDARCLPGLITARTRAILVVHLAGWPCDMEPILAIARQHNLAVVEDCAQAHGATYRGQPVGSLGDVAAFSFCTDKIISTGGEGGMLVTGRKDIWQKVWSYKDHGKSYAVTAGGQSMGAERQLYERVGTNGRLTEMQSAIGLCQLARLPQMLEQRRANALRLNQGLAGVPGLRLTVPPEGFGHAYYKYYCHLQPDALKSDWQRERIMALLRTAGIPCQTGSDSELYLEQVFQARGWHPAQPWPVARAVGESSLVLPVHPGLEETHMGWIIQKLTEIMLMASGKDRS